MGYGDCGTAGQQSRRSKVTNHYFLNEQWHHVVAVFTDEVKAEYVTLVDAIDNPVTKMHFAAKRYKD